MSNATDIYEYHHSQNREEGFSVLLKERGELFRHWTGTGKRVLDVGCRDGVLTKYVVPGNEVIGIDVDRNALKRAEENLHIKTDVVDVTAEWPYEGEFDVIMMGEVLEHLYYPDRIAAHVKTALKPGGIFIGSVPNAFSLKHRIRYLFARTRQTPLSDPTHINQFSYQRLYDTLKKEFSKVEIVGLGRYGRLSRLFPSLVAFDLAWRAEI